MLSNEQMQEQLKEVLFHENWGKKPRDARVTEESASPSETVRYHDVQRPPSPPLPPPIGMLRFDNKIGKLFYNYDDYAPGMRVVVSIDQGWDIATVRWVSCNNEATKKDNFVDVQRPATNRDIMCQAEIKQEANGYIGPIQNIFDELKVPARVSEIVIRADRMQIDIFFRYTGTKKPALESARCKIFKLVQMRMRIMFHWLRD